MVFALVARSFFFKNSISKILLLHDEQHPQPSARMANFLSKNLLLRLVVFVFSRLDFLKIGIQIPPRKLAAVILLFSNTLAWFYVFNTYILNMILMKGFSLQWTIIANVLFYVFVVLSGITGSLISEKVDRRRFLGCWISFGLVNTVLILFFQGLEFGILSSILLGISFGLGFPTCQAFLTESTVAEERGRIAGITIFIAFFIVVVILMLAESVGMTGLILICATLKGSSLITLIIDKSEKQKGTPFSWTAILRKKSFTSYAIPWFIFHFANGIALFGSTPEGISEVAVFGDVIEFLGTLFTVLIAGLLVDRIGRKQPMLVGLLILGISYVLYGTVTTQLTYIINVLVEGIAWGLIAVSYMIVILGDISSGYSTKERFYSMGGILIPLLTYTVFSGIQQLSKITVPLNSLSTVLSIIIFISVIPILRAPETLSESNIQKRLYKEHVEKVGKIIQEDKKARDRS